MNNNIQKKEVVNYKISLILPTRKRTKLLSQYIDSVLDKANLKNP
jgi:hypothetical protein